MLYEQYHQLDLYVINTFLSEKKYDKCKLYFDKYKFISKLKGYTSLHFRYGIETNNNNIIDYYLVNNSKLKQIDIILYCIYIYNTNIDKCINIFKKNIIDNHSLLPKNLNKLIKNNCYKLLLLLDGYYIKLPSNNNNISFNLKKYNFYNIEDVIEFYKKKITMYNELLLKLNNIDCIVDGGNIIHYNKGKIDYNMIILMDKNIKKKLKNPLYIFNIRHKKKIKNFIKNNNVFITPAKEYDDIYIIIACILTNNYIITNDIFRDHIFMIKNIDKSFIIEKIQDNLIKYNKKGLFNINKYSNCIQIKENEIYIPQ